MTMSSAVQTLKKGAILFMAVFFISITEEFSFRTSAHAATKCSPGAIHPCKMYPDLCAAGNGLCVFKSPCEYECKCPPLWTRHRTCVGVGGASSSLSSGSNSNSNAGRGGALSEPVGSLVDSLLINPPDLFWDIKHVAKPGEYLSMTPTTTTATVVAATDTSTTTGAPSPPAAATTSQTSPSPSAPTTQHRVASNESSRMQRPDVMNTRMTTKAPQNSMAVDHQQSSSSSGAVGSESGSVVVVSTNDQPAVSKTPAPSPPHIANPLSASALSALLDPPSNPPPASQTQSGQNTMSGAGRTSVILSAISPQRHSSASTGSASPGTSNSQPSQSLTGAGDQTARHSSNIKAIVESARNSVQALANPGVASDGSSAAATTNESSPPSSKNSLPSSSSTMATVVTTTAETASSKETAAQTQPPFMPTSSITNNSPARQTTKDQPSSPSPSNNAASTGNTMTTTVAATTIQSTTPQATAAPTTMSNEDTKTTSSASTANNMSPTRPSSTARDHPSLFGHQDSFPTLFSEVPNAPSTGDHQNAPLSTVIHRVFHPIGGLRFKVKR